MIGAIVPWLADAVVLIGLSVLTLSVYGILRLPTITTQIHAGSKAGVVGVIPILLAATLGTDAEALPKAVLVAGFLFLTSPIVAHEIGRAAHLPQRQHLQVESVTQIERTGSAQRTTAGEDA